MKRLILLFFAIVSIVNVFAQSKQDGFVKEYSEKSKKKPLVGVQVLVANANHDVSGKNGDFHLQFRTLKPGDPVHVQNVIKLGYEVFNKEQLEVWRISRSNEPFTIVMCKSSVLKALKDEYNAIAYKSFSEQRKKELKIWDDQLKQGRVQQKEYDKQVSALCDYYDKKLENLDTYIDRFARIDMNEITREERRIVELVRKGMIQEAIDEYNALKLDEELIKNYKEYQKTDAAIKKLTDVSQKKHAYEDELLASLNNKFNLMMMQGSRDAVDQILVEYETLVEKCPNSISILRSFVDFAENELDYTRVAKWGRVLVDLISDDMPISKGFYCNRVANALGFIEDENQAYLYRERAFEWAEKSEKTNPTIAIKARIRFELDNLIDLHLTENGLAKILERTETLIHMVDSICAKYPTDDMRHTYLSDKYLIYQNLAHAYMRLNDITKAIESNDKSILYMDSLLMVDNSNQTKAKLASVYNQAAYFKMLVSDFENSELLLNKAASIIGEIEKSGSYKYYIYRQGNYVYKGLLYYYTGRIQEAIDIYKEAMEFSSEVIETRPLPLLITSYSEFVNNLGFLCFSIGDDKTAEETYLLAIEKSRPFVESNPYKHLSIQCTAQINLGMLKLKQGRLAEFVALQDSYWDNTEKAYGWYGLDFKTSYVVAWDNKGYYSLLQGNTEEALSIWKKINEIDSTYLNNNQASLLYKALKDRGLLE